MGGFVRAFLKLEKDHSEPRDVKILHINGALCGMHEADVNKFKVSLILRQPTEDSFTFSRFTCIFLFAAQFNL